jgi:hypothetical protein
MTETMKYPTFSIPPQEPFSRFHGLRQGLLRRYERLWSHLALWGRVLSIVQFNLSSSALRRSR